MNQAVYNYTVTVTADSLLGAKKRAAELLFCNVTDIEFEIVTEDKSEFTIKARQRGSEPILTD